MIAIGCGGAFAEDRIDWAVELAESGLVEYMGFDCLAERSIALANHRRAAGVGSAALGQVGLNRPIFSEGGFEQQGQDPRLSQIVREFIPFLKEGKRVVGNFGAANPAAAGAEVVAGLQKGGLTGTKVGVIHGDDVLKQVLELNPELSEIGCKVSDIESQVFAANAYIGIEGIIELLQQGAAFVLGGRIADAAVFAGPICHELGWSLDDLDRVATAYAAGHLLECATHVTGGNFPDPPVQVIPNPWDLSFPIAEVSDNGDIVITKIPSKGVIVNDRTVKVQLSYEVHDPSRYFTPDVTADFSQAEAINIGKDRVLVKGITGSRKPDTLRVMVAMNLGWKASAEMTFGGPGCVERARLGEEIVRKRLDRISGDIEILRTDIVGINSLYGDNYSSGYPAEVRLRVFGRCPTKEAAAEIIMETAYVVFGPAATTGGSPARLEPAIGVTPAFIPRDAVNIETEVLTA